MASTGWHLGVLGAATPPDGPAYTLVLLAHVLAAVVGFGSLAGSGLAAARARRGPDSAAADGVRRWLRPGVNVAGRVLYLVPALGFALLALSRGAFRASDPFVVAGLVLWTGAVVLAEGVLWPAEAAVAAAVHGDWRPGDAELDRRCTTVVRAAGALGLVFVAAVVLMVARP